VPSSSPFLLRPLIPLTGLNSTACRANAWYFWSTSSTRFAFLPLADLFLTDSETQETTWSNPRDAAVNEETQAEPPVASGSNGPVDELPEIDPDLAWLDPAAAARSKGSKALGGVAQTARFNARTGRFQVRIFLRRPSHLIVLTIHSPHRLIPHSTRTESATSNEGSVSKKRTTMASPSFFEFPCSIH
jgi:hypothetical protein